MIFFLIRLREMLFMDKRGEMEMWQIVLMILAIIMLLAFLVWYSFLSDSASNLLQRVGNML